MLVCRWLWAIDQDFKVGVYLSDISGAFDKVDRHLLRNQLADVGVSGSMLEFLFDYLAPRRAVVVVQGHESEEFIIDDQVFQGTVLGPPLWHVFFESVDNVLLTVLFNLAKFADDLTAFKNFESSMSNGLIKQELVACQQAVHRWGVSSRMTFDAMKEHLCVLHRREPLGDAFKLLGVLIDTKLNMVEEISRIKKKAAPKINGILASRRFYGEKYLIKAHVLCLLEVSIGAIYHTAESHLDELDALQRRFIRELNLSDREAFERYNLAPLRLR